MSLNTMPIPIIGPTTATGPIGTNKFPWAALLALSTSAFFSVSAEMLPTGLLPELSAAFGTDAAAIGYTMSVFAFMVVITSAPLTMLTRRFNRKHVLVVAILTVALGSLLTAFSVNYAMLVGSRVIGGMGHGLFWTMVGSYPSYLVGPAMLGRAVAVNGAGGTLAFMFGLPFGTLLGHAWGWSAAFLVVAGLTALCAVAVFVLVPGVKLPTTQPAQQEGVPTKRPSAFRNRTMWPSLLVSLTLAAMFVGHYTFYTYISEYITGMMGVAENGRAIILAIYGAAGAIGLFLAGTVMGRHPLAWGVGMILVNTVTYVFTALFAHHLAVAVVLLTVMGTIMGAVMPIMQLLLLRTAATEIRDIASAFFTTAANFGIGAGSFVGGMLLTHLGYVQNAVGATVLMLISGLVLGLVYAPARARLQQSR